LSQKLKQRLDRHRNNHDKNENSQYGQNTCFGSGSGHSGKPSALIIFTSWRRIVRLGEGTCPRSYRK
jgi:hypothetical protein